MVLLLSVQVIAQRDLSRYVDPFVGTAGHGHTFPGATMPFGMVQLSPDTRLTGWDGCSGYHYSDNITYGFSHTHLSGTGISDYGDILLMPGGHAPAPGDFIFSNRERGHARLPNIEKVRVSHRRKRRRAAALQRVTVPGVSPESLEECAAC
jgi:putative alpha-1,2-mannosidase